ncbi:twin-arginine translocase TatA/TatE family subunit [Alkalimonas sp. MEB108]|uniref:Twin-arginine translocase TatA/TatE family subunit n=1 Tax=Alkalimonas cellulosilytica TaxID=3058395 RepID=A0ABU7J4B7_9GAMM|nr:twin-arginine translocase TatA/TatE family subunit [Alkalimonas sp. MEB108]MEE2001334.1 twin-arginine translocase TatA/TatE family subunit [Alkalimonas sp. MEB108]
MFDLSWMELVFLAILALIVVGPKDLPKLARGIGQMWSKGRRLYLDMQQKLHRLETEMELAKGDDPTKAPSYYDLLPEHVRQAMERPEPSRDAAENQRIEQEYRQAMTELEQQHAAKQAELHHEG